MSESDMVERVSRALYKKRRPWGDPDKVDGYLPAWHFCIDDARAAIAAMREPTWAMVDAAPDEIRTDLAVIHCWRAMIDAALTDTARSSEGSATRSSSAGA